MAMFNKQCQWKSSDVHTEPPLLSVKQEKKSFKLYVIFPINEIIDCIVL